MHHCNLDCFVSWHGLEMGGQIAESFFQVSAEEVDKDSKACV